MSAWSVAINGNTYTEANVNGNAYSNPDTGLPAILRDVVQHVASGWQAASSTPVALVPGTAAVTLTTQRPFGAGMPILLTVIGNPSLWARGTLAAYDPETGAASVQIAAVNGTGTHANWHVTVDWAIAVAAQVAAEAAAGAAENAAVLAGQHAASVFVSPAFSGVPTAPTAAPGTNTPQLATTAFVRAAVAAADTGAPLVSPAFTGTPTAPTAAPGTSTTQLATTAFVQAAGAALLAWKLKAAAYTAVVGDRILAHTGSGPFTVTLPPAPVAGDRVEFADGGGAFANNNLTIGRNGKTIMGLAEDLNVRTNNASFALVYNGSTWRLA